MTYEDWLDLARQEPAYRRRRGRGLGLGGALVTTAPSGWRSSMAEGEEGDRGRRSIIRTHRREGGGAHASSARPSLDAAGVTARSSVLAITLEARSPSGEELRIEAEGLAASGSSTRSTISTAKRSRRTNPTQRRGALGRAPADGASARSVEADRPRRLRCSALGRRVRGTTDVELLRLASAWTHKGRGRRVGRGPPAKSAAERLSVPICSGR